MSQRGANEASASTRLLYRRTDPPRMAAAAAASKEELPAVGGSEEASRTAHTASRSRTLPPAAAVRTTSCCRWEDLLFDFHAFSGGMRSKERQPTWQEEKGLAYAALPPPPPDHDSLHHVDVVDRHVGPHPAAARGMENVRANKNDPAQGLVGGLNKATVSIEKKPCESIHRQKTKTSPLSVLDAEGNLHDFPRIEWPESSQEGANLDDDHVSARDEAVEVLAHEEAALRVADKRVPHTAGARRIDFDTSSSSHCQTEPIAVTAVSDSKNNGLLLPEHAKLADDVLLSQEWESFDSSGTAGGVSFDIEESARTISKAIAQDDVLLDDFPYDIPSSQNSISSSSSSSSSKSSSATKQDAVTTSTLPPTTVVCNASSFDECPPRLSFALNSQAQPPPLTEEPPKRDFNDIVLELLEKGSGDMTPKKPAIYYQTSETKPAVLKDDKAFYADTTTLSDQKRTTSAGNSETKAATAASSLKIEKSLAAPLDQLEHSATLQSVSLAVGKLEHEPEEEEEGVAADTSAGRNAEQSTRITGGTLSTSLVKQQSCKQVTFVLPETQIDDAKEQDQACERSSILLRLFFVSAMLLGMLKTSALSCRRPVVVVHNADNAFLELRLQVIEYETGI